MNDASKPSSIMDSRLVFHVENNENSLEKQLIMNMDWPGMVEYLIGHEIKEMNDKLP